MGMLSFVILLSTLSVVTLSCTLNSNGQCKKIPLIPGVQLEGVDGKWYVQKVGSKALGAHKCLTFDLNVEKRPGGVVITSIASSLSQKPTELYKLFSVNNTSYFKTEVNENRDERELKDSWLVSTDYKSYSLWYLCVPETINSGVVFLATRERHPKGSVVTHMEAILKKLGFDLNNSYLQVIDHSKCN